MNSISLFCVLILLFQSVSTTLSLSGTKSPLDLKVEHFKELLKKYPKNSLGTLLDEKFTNDDIELVTNNLDKFDNDEKLNLLKGVDIWILTFSNHHNDPEKDVPIAIFEKLLKVIDLQQKLSKKPQISKDNGLILSTPRKGLKNVGNACYFSSVLQVFRHAPSYLLEGFPKNLDCTFNEKGASVLCAVRNLLLLSGSPDIIVPKFEKENYNGIMKKLCVPKIPLNLQNDLIKNLKIEERMKIILNENARLTIAERNSLIHGDIQIRQAIMNEMNENSDCSTMEIAMMKYLRESFGGGMQDDAGVLILRISEALKSYKLENDKMIVERFFEKFFVTIENTDQYDSGLKIINAKTEESHYLGIKIAKDIQEGIDKLFQGERITKRDVNSGENLEMLRIPKLKNIPEILAINIQRLELLKKNNTVELVKNLTPVGISEVISIPAANNSKEREIKYKLYAIINYKSKDIHDSSGKMADEGHYIAHIKLGDGKWWEFDDSKEPKEKALPKESGNAYILYYIKME